MTSVFARTIGINSDAPVETDDAVLIVRRRSNLPPQLARLVVLDYKGSNNHEAAKKLKVSLETLKCYWRRVYTKLNYKHCDNRREVVRAWVENILRAELESSERSRSS